MKYHTLFLFFSVSKFCICWQYFILLNVYLAVTFMTLRQVSDMQLKTRNKSGCVQTQLCLINKKCAMDCFYIHSHDIVQLFFAMETFITCGKTRLFCMQKARMKRLINHLNYSQIGDCKRKHNFLIWCKRTLRPVVPAVQSLLYYSSKNPGEFKINLICQGI